MGLSTAVTVGNEKFIILISRKAPNLAKATPESLHLPT